MDQQRYVIGIDFGTDWVRSLIVNSKDGSEISSSVKYYPDQEKAKKYDLLYKKYTALGEYVENNT
ncbi:hypothetical protein ACFL6O_03735 [candidate division KSB1 bacterium]